MRGVTKCPPNSGSKYQVVHNRENESSTLQDKNFDKILKIPVDYNPYSGDSLHAEKNYEDEVFIIPRGYGSIYTEPGATSKSTSNEGGLGIPTGKIMALEREFAGKPPLGPLTTYNQLNQDPGSALPVDRLTPLQKNYPAVAYSKADDVTITYDTDKEPQVKITVPQDYLRNFDPPKDSVHFSNLRYVDKTPLPSGVMTTSVDPTYVESFTKRNNVQLSVLQEPSIKYELFDHYLAVNSGSRDEVYKLHYDYRLSLEKPYKNVRSVEMVSAILPNQPDTIDQQPFLSIDIDELNHIDFSSTKIAHKAFAILPLKVPGKTGGFIVPDLGAIYHTALTFRTPLAILGSLTIKIRDIYGQFFTFGRPEGTLEKEFQNSFVFKITVEDVSRTPLNQRNVY
jgi:hypothetical protein